MFVFNIRKHVHERKKWKKEFCSSHGARCELYTFIVQSMVNVYGNWRCACSNHVCYLWWFCFLLFHWILVERSATAFNFCLWLCRWAVGVLIYFMLQGEMPFGSWRDSELDTFAKIAKGQLNLPSNFSHEAVELITQVLLKLLKFFPSWFFSLFMQ